MRVIGIDPGKSGGIAWCVDGFMQVWATPKTEADIARLFFDFSQFKDTHCFIEKVHSMPKQGVVSTFTFGQGYGFLRACLVCHKIPFEEVTPSKWQKALGCVARGDKNKLKAKAQQLFPDLDVTLKTADALLICEYGRRECAKREFNEE